MSLPIKIVEDSNQSPAKIINICQPKQINQNQNFSNSSFFQFNQNNNSFSSSTINKYLDLPTFPNNKLFTNENFTFLNDNKKKDNDILIKLASPIFKTDAKKSINDINREEKKELNNINKQIPNLLSSYNNNENVDESFNDKNFENIYKENKDSYNLNINKKNDSSNFNNCLNKIIKNNEINNYLRELKIFTTKTINSLALIYSKSEYLLNPSKDIDSNNSKMDIERNTNLKSEENEETLNNRNLINQKNKDKDKNNTKEDNNLLSPKINLNFLQKEKNIKPFLNAHKHKNIFKQKKHDSKEESNLNNNIMHGKVKSLKRIGSRKFNIKSRGLRYNILTEEMKKQLLLDAMNMRTVEVAKKYGISTRNVNRWKKKGIQRKKGSGRKFKDPRLERKILEWYKMQDKDTLTSRQFKEKAIELSDNKTFRASSGWLTNMKRKYNINFKKY